MSHARYNDFSVRFCSGSVSCQDQFSSISTAFILSLVFSSNVSFCWKQTFQLTLKLQQPEYHCYCKLNVFHRAMHFSASAVLRSHVVCLSVCLSMTLVDCDHIGWNSSKIISPLVSVGCSLFATPTWRVCSKGNTPKFSPEWGWGAEKAAFGLSAYKSSNISETRQDGTKVAIKVE